MESRLHRIVHELPKVDLHRHLEGSVRPKTMLEISRENNISLPIYNLERLASLVTIKAPVTNLREYLKPLLIVQRCFCNEDAIKRITYEVIEDASKDNVEYLELIIGPAFMAGAHSLSLDEIFRGVLGGVKVAKESFPTEVGLIVRPSLRWKEHMWHSPSEVVEAAISYMDRGVVGFGLSSESKEGELILRTSSHIREEFINAARIAKRAGLPITVHAGEVSSAESVWDAIEYLNADRIGHAVKTVESQKILKHIIKKKIPLEICLTSNVMSHAVSNIREHPFKRLYEMGAIVTLNTDDPSLCRITATSEFLLAMKTFQLSLTDIKKIILNGISASFLSPQEKEEMSKSIVL